MQFCFSGRADHPFLVRMMQDVCLQELQKGLMDKCVCILIVGTRGLI